ncbi:hypothetical protein B0J11DRAFT_416739, partial [Dendryphion nanum]
MGGHAWPRLNTPRMSEDLYLKTRNQSFRILSRVFAHIAVPTEMPAKEDYGDIDFLVAEPLTSSSTNFDFNHHVCLLKKRFKKAYCRVGFHAKDIIFLAIPAPGRENDFYIQIDIKICRKPEFFAWEHFRHNYASAAKILGSMAKPLGLTIDDDGLWIRVDGLDKVDLGRSMVWLSKEPRDFLRIAGLDQKILKKEFKTKQELFEHLASTWLFHPGHFAERLKDENFVKHLTDRSAPFVDFVKKWIPEHYPEYKVSDRETSDVQDWYKATRDLVKERVFTLFPAAAKEYYTKLNSFNLEVEEQRLRDLIRAAIPIGHESFTQDIKQPLIIIKALPSNVVPQISMEMLNSGIGGLPPLITSPLTPPGSSSGNPSPGSSDSTSSLAPSPSPLSLSSPTSGPLTTFPNPTPADAPLLLDALPRTPPVARPTRSQLPPHNMSIDAKMHCIGRWTGFTPSGKPYILLEPRDKAEYTTFKWLDGEATDEVLEKWASEMWWVIWARQVHISYVGRWKRTFEKEDKAIEK